MSNPEALHQENEHIRHRILGHLDEIMTEGAITDKVAYPHVVGQGPVPMLAGMVNGGHPMGPAASPMRARVVHEGTPDGPAYSVGIEPVDSPGPASVMKLNREQGVSMIRGTTPKPLDARDYRLLSGVLNSTVFTEAETLQVVDDLRKRGLLCKPPQATIREYLYVGMWTAYLAIQH